MNILNNICPKRYLTKIFRQGLKPKSSEWKDFAHSDRVYFYIDVPSEDDISDMESEKGDCAVLEIDVSKLKNISFYKDCRKHGAVYSFDNIPSNCISTL